MRVAQSANYRQRVIPELMCSLRSREKISNSFILSSNRIRCTILVGEEFESCRQRVALCVRATTMCVSEHTEIGFSGGCCDVDADIL
jgi:hypothetical protein